MIFLEPGRTKDGDAGADKMEGTKSFDEFQEYPPRGI
jgi:hypothetical protein